MAGQKGNIFEIQHFSVNDGPGIRTTVFLKGCQLKCIWCHNPESIDKRYGELAFVSSKCIECGNCFKVCPKGCHRIEDGIHIIHRDQCVFCGKCVNLCPGRALSICADREWDTREVLEEVLRDKSYYEESGGGMTLSGGEPMMQADFVRELASKAKRKNINIAMETNGCYDFSLLNGIKENIDHFLIDWKVSDPEKHKAYTGARNEMVYRTIKSLHDEGRDVLLRCPIIPGYNDSEDHFRKIAEMTREMPGLRGAELLPYHSLGVNKIEKFGLQDRVEYIVSTSPPKEQVDQWIDRCISYGGRIINEK